MQTRWAFILALTLPIASCGDSPDSVRTSAQLPQQEALGDEATMTIEADWICIATPRDLADISTVVVRVEPTSDETTLKVIEEPDRRTEWRVSNARVIDVLAGQGVSPGETIQIGRTITRATVTVNGRAEERRFVGPGYPGPLTGSAWVLGLDLAPHSGEQGVWAAVQGTHGRVALDGKTEDAKVLEAAPGYDGHLQASYAGRNLEVLESDLDSPAGDSACQEAE